MKRLLRRSCGQLAVLFALIFVGLLGAVALGTDVAVKYVNWQQMQKVADAAALAGANFMAGGITFDGTAAAGCSGLPDAAKIAACTYAANNGLDPASVTITEPNASTIQVVAQKTGLPYYFGKVVGLTTYSVSATANAGAGGPVGTVSQGLFPVGLQCTAPCNLSNLDPGQSVSFGSKFVGGLAPGNWQWLDPTGGSGGGDSALSSAIESGASASFKIGGTIQSEPGNKGKSGPVKSAMSGRLKSCPSISDPCGGDGNPSDIPAGDPCLVIVPAVDFNGCTGNCSLTIEGFAEVYLEPATTTSTHIDGCFVQSVVADTLASSGAPSLGPVQVPMLSN
ncbi:MAG: pilus assembly protein TadG-related protein [Candidatus Binataceae bacterium]